MVEGYVYFLLAREVGRVKIGRSIDIERRLSEIRLLSPCALELVGYIEGGAKLETEYHRRWAHLRQHGEWFTALPDLIVELEVASLVSAWNRACPEARTRAREQMAGPVFDNTRAA